MGSFFLPEGIPIPQEIHDLFSAEVKQAWETFNGWWQEADRSGSSRSSMPLEVREAFDLILRTPIPTYEEKGKTGKDSCYMVYVQSLLVDWLTNF